jgi:MoaA/NifB/PqqE/SkfB family radical SAM enzyme
MDLLKKSLYYLSRFLVKPLIPPEMLILSLTECCNLKCITCGIKKEITKENLDVDVKKIFNILYQAQEMKVKTVVLSGGEPFLVKEIFEIAEYIKKLKMTVCVTTNGFYSDQLLNKIAGSQIDHLHFSLDGLGRHHDEIRGEGSYDRLMHAVSLIRQLNPGQSIGFGTVICSKNCNDLFEMTKIVDNLKVNSMNFIPFLANNIDPQHSRKGRKYHQLWPEGKDLIDLERNFKMIFGYQYKQLKIDLNPDFNLLHDYYSLKPISRKCFAGYKSMIITAPRKHNGKLTSNVFFCQDSCGNIYDMPLKKAWNSLKAAKMRLKARMCNNPCLQFCHYI